jgi:biopolymer transport protein ExbB/TolQ
MMEEFLSGGIMMWPMTAMAMGIAWIAVRTAARLRTKSPPREVRPGLEAILFWGGMGLLIGVLGTVVGLVMMADLIQRVGPLDPPLLWGGVAVSLVTFAFGILIFVFAGAAWLVLSRWDLQAVDEDGAVLD